MASQIYGVLASFTNNILQGAVTFNGKNYYVAWTILVPGKTWSNLVSDWVALPTGRRDEAYEWVRPLAKVSFNTIGQPVLPAVEGYTTAIVDLTDNTDDFFRFLYAFYGAQIAAMTGVSTSTSSTWAAWKEL